MISWPREFHWWRVFSISWHTSCTEIFAKKKLTQPKTWADLLKPEYKGEIQSANPASSGTAYTIYVPEFRREIEEPVAGAIAVLPNMPLVITEGNYLLLEDKHWADVAPMLDEVWYVDLDRTLRMGRLARRHEAYGRGPQEAID